MQPEPSGIGPGRLLAFDGLRGIVALSVIIFHFFFEVLGQRFPIYSGPLLAGLTSSNTGIFLMLSGYVLTEGNWRLAHKPRVHRQLVKRYFRLTIPMLASVLVVLALVWAGLCYHVPASWLLGVESWLGDKLPMQATLGDAIYDATIRVYLPHPDALSYNPFLWTMQAELWGSLTLFAILLLDRRISPYATLFVAAALFFSVRPITCSIIIGGLISLLRHDGHLDGAIEEMRRKPWLQVCYLMTAFSLGSLAMPVGLQQIAAPLAGILVIVPLLASKSMQKLLSTEPMQFLGKLSLPLLLVQFPVLISFTSWAMLWLKGTGSFNLASATLVAINSSLLCVLGAFAFLPVEEGTGRFCSWLTRLVFGPAPPRQAFAPMPSSPSGRPIPAASR
ncbi:MAG: acyltransferase [Proteobacteria bacterium]|nr:MAG: acyltransferase [Pseudomonadota bacterium]